MRELKEKHDKISKSCCKIQGVGIQVVGTSYSPRKEDASSAVDPEDNRVNSALVDRKIPEILRVR